PWPVETHGLTKKFGDNIAVNDVELLVPRGCAFGYLGPNGAGKTTLIRMLLGLTHADAGTMSLLGYEVPRHRDLALGGGGRDCGRAALSQPSHWQTEPRALRGTSGACREGSHRPSTRARRHDA